MDSGSHQDGTRLLIRREQRRQREEALAALGLERHVMATVSGFAPAIAVARASDLVATVPERHTAALRAGMRTFGLPFRLPSIVA